MTDWKVRVAGANCPFDKPRTDIEKIFCPVQTLSIATLYLDRIQTYKGHCVLVFDPRHVTRIDELTPHEWRQLSVDIMVAQTALVRAFEPDHINVVSLGQVVPHLHWHIIPRYRDDPRWGGPIWTSDPDDMQKVYLDDQAYRQRADQIRHELAQPGV